MNTLLDDNILLIDKEKQELIDIILKQREKIKELENALESEKSKTSASYVPSRPKKKYWKKFGTPGHTGATRIKPQVIDRVEYSSLESCPDCKKNHLTRLPSQDTEHIQEDIVPAKVEAVKFVRKAYWCSGCHSKQYAPHAPEEIPSSYVGPNVLVHTVLLKYHHGLPYSKIKLVFKELCNLEITESALAQALQRMSRWLKVEEDEIIRAIRESPHIHGDETGWKIAGTTHWLWAFVNKRLALYRIRQSRGRAVPKEVLKDDYGGVVISDFYSAYSKSGKRRQRCLVHLVREMNKCQKNDNSLEYRIHHKKLKRILRDAKRLSDNRQTLNPVIFMRRLTRIKERLFEFSCQVFSNKNWQRLSKRFLKHHNEMFTFLEMKDIPSDNNHAERMIRPNVIFRKISRQNMSKAGATAHEVLMSILQTLRLKKDNPINFFKEAYLKHRQGNPDLIFAL
jgi:transposase